MEKSDNSNCLEEIVKLGFNGINIAATPVLIGGMIICATALLTFYGIPNLFYQTGKEIKYKLTKTPYKVGRDGIYLKIEKKSQSDIDFEKLII